MEIASQPVEVVIGHTSVTIYKFKKGTKLLTYLLLKEGKDDPFGQGLVGSFIDEATFDEMGKLIVRWNTLGY